MNQGAKYINYVIHKLCLQKHKHDTLHFKNTLSVENVEWIFNY